MTSPKAQSAQEVPHLKKLRAEYSGKTRITIMLDDDIIEQFRHRAETEGRGYQTEINRALREYLADERLTLDSIRQVVREELNAEAP